MLLAAANLPPTFHAFAVQMAAWLCNRLPRSTRGWKSPYELLTRSKPDLSNIYAFGCLCGMHLPAASAWRSGDKHLADRGAFGLYLGPSEESPGHIVYLTARSKVIVVPQIQAWEDEFPGVKGDRFSWFADEPAAAAPPQGGVPATLSALPAAPQNAPVGQVPPDATLHASGPTQAPLPLLPPPSPSQDSPASTTLPAASPAAPRDPATLPSVSFPQGGGISGGAQTKDTGLEGSYWTKPPSGAMGADSRPKRQTAQRRPDFVYGQLAMLAVASALMALPSTGPADNAVSVESSLGSIDKAFYSYTRARDSGDADALVAAASAATFCYSVTITADFGDLIVPKSYRHAMRSPQVSYWKEAIAKELAGLTALNTWSLVPLSSMPPGSNLMNCHFVFDVKRKKSGEVEKFKARLVADGNTQKHGCDFDRVFATVVKSQTIRMALILAVARDYNLTSIDITQAYLQAELKEDLFMRVPPGVASTDPQGVPLVCKLNRSLYGLKQAGREWAVLFSSFLTSWGMVRSTIDVCLYTYSSGNDILWCLVYVDDALICDNNPALRARFVRDLGQRFPLVDKGDLAWILNVGVSRDRSRRTLTISQSLYIADLLAKYGEYIDESVTRTFDTPLDEACDLSPLDQPEIGSAAYDAMAAQRQIYMSLVGGYQWLANMTFPELAYAAGQLARYLTNPGAPHFKAAIRVLLYLRGAAERSLVFAPDSTRGLETYVDSSWAAKFSCSGGLFFLHGCLFFWFSKMQRSVALSSAEAEYFGAMLAARELLFAIDLALEFGLEFQGPSVIYCDSKSAVEMAYDPVSFKKTKHIMRAAEYLRDLVAREAIMVKHLPGSRMIADLLTKAVARPLFRELLRLLDAFAADGTACLP